MKKCEYCRGDGTNWRGRNNEDCGFCYGTGQVSSGELADKDSLVSSMEGLIGEYKNLRKETKQLEECANQLAYALGNTIAIQNLKNIKYSLDQRAYAIRQQIHKMGYVEKD